MQASRTGPVAAPVVAQRLCDLLLQFPSAAAGGVRWRVLVRRYEERHGSRLDLASLGHSSSLAAASALLWDVLRLGGAPEQEDPLLALEEGVALTPRPGFCGTWPSLYASLHAAVLGHGVRESGGARCLLLSQLKPLLQSLWHSSFDEYGMGYFNAEGAFVKLRKMKHLVQSVLSWREERLAWRRTAGGQATRLDQVLQPRLELSVSKSHNDLVLRCFEDTVPLLPTPGASTERGEAVLEAAEDSMSSSAVSCRTSAAEEDFQRELQELRAENAALRRRNEQILSAQDAAPCCAGAQLVFVAPTQDELKELEENAFDNPFEPPPQRPHWAHFATPCSSSTATPMRTLSFDSSASSRASATPVGPYDHGEAAPCLVPVWFAWMLGDRARIPTGIVGRLRSQFEAAAKRR